ncbi:MAG: zinc-ribbon domain-containing protein, partial [Candidatus Entotheonellia bacterium]
MARIRPGAHPARRATMELSCDACQATIHIPDERVPQGATFRVTCPRCKQRIIASGRKPEV